MKNPTILITGGSGFIGRNLLELLPVSYKILSPTHKELELLNETAVENYFKSHSIDVVIHCANFGGARNATRFPDVAVTNLRVFFNIIRCKKRFKKMIFLGSGAEYDKRRLLIKIKESDFEKFIPADEYGFYKFVCSQYIQQSENIINLRLFGVYGKYEDYSLRFISEAICRNILGMPIVINQNVVFDYLYVNDLVKIIDFFIKNNPKEKILNVGRGEKMDLLTIANLINLIALKKSKIILKNKGLQNEYTCNNSLLLKSLKKFEFTDFKDSLRELHIYYMGIKDFLKIK